MRSPVLLLLLVGCMNTSTPPVAPKAPEPPQAPRPPEPPPEAPVGATPPAVDWVSAAVAEALEWEIMPGTSAEPDDGTRAAALRAFFEAHPEYADAEKRARLADHACGLDGTEKAHEYLVNPPAREPAYVDVTAADWKVAVVHADKFCVSDDWVWYSSEVTTAAEARGTTTGFAGPRNDVLVVRKGGAEVARVPVSGQGMLVLRAGAEAKDIAYNTSDVMMAEFDAYFGPPKK